MSNDPVDTSVAREQTNVLQPEYIPARILWPALGFPEIVDPSKQDSAGDHTACVHVVLIAAKKDLSAVDVERHLRWATWQQRRTRFLDPGEHSFPVKDISVAPVAFASSDSPLTYRIMVAAGTIALALAKEVWSTYQAVWGQSIGLYEVTISRSASSSLPSGLLNLYWVNRRREDTPNDPSNEMYDLLEKFVKPRLAKEFPTKSWAQVSASIPYKDSDEMAKDYEFEWSPPPGSPAPSADRRVEVLHPLLITSGSSSLRIGHVTDIHIGIREDVFEDRAHHIAPPSEALPELDQHPSGNKGRHPSDDMSRPDDDDRLLKDYEQKATQPLLPKSRWKAYNNPNRRFDEIYKHSKGDSDILLLTGDLIDFGRGHVGDSNAALGNIDNYWLDRNWFLFYKLLASGNLYEKPAFTSLGNHDWRINPYPPLGQFKTNKNYNLTEQEVETIHGPNARASVYTRSGPEYLQVAVEWFMSGHSQDSMPDTGMALVTTTHSVIWYLLLINPFLDYSVQLPSGYALLMLDWGRDEETIKGSLNIDTSKPRWGIISSYDPVAWQALSDDQKELVLHFVSRTSKAKILGIHSPLIGPNSGWPTDHMRTGWVHDSDGEFPVIALGPDAITDTPFPANRRPAYGSIKHHLYWILNQLRHNSVSLVLAGHLHRHAMFVIANPKKAGPAQRLQFGMALCFVETELSSVWSDHGPPVFVNTTCAGPIGHDVPFPGNNEIQIRPGYSQITIQNDGKVVQIEERYADWSF